MTEKTFGNTTFSGAEKNVEDIQKFGDADSFKLICKAWSQKEGWMKSTKALEVKNAGCFLQVTTQQKNDDGSYSVAEAVTWAPGIKIVGEGDQRRLVGIEEV